MLLHIKKLATYFGMMCHIQMKNEVSANNLIMQHESNLLGQLQESKAAQL